MRTLITLVSLTFIMAMTFFIEPKPTPHSCPFGMCPMTGEVYFSPQYDGCDNYICTQLDSIHWAYPTFDYDQCDSVLTVWSKSNPALADSIARFEAIEMQRLEYQGLR